MVKFLAVVSTRSGSSFVSLASLSRISTAVTMLVPHSQSDIRLDQPQSSPSPRFRTLPHNSCRVRPLGHDPHHAKAACCRKLLVMNPNLPDGLLETNLTTC